MKQIVVITTFFAIITVAVFGCLLIFDVMSSDAAMDMLLKFEAAIVLLGGCAVLLTYLFKGKPDD